MRHARWLALGTCLTIGLALAADDPAQPPVKGRPGARPGEVNTPPARGERQPDRLQVGDPAPDFSLADPSGKNAVKLSGFQGKKPVVLIFGSYT
jgi:hypothetical protein